MASILVVFWFWAVYLFFSVVATKMAAYPLIAAPAIWMMTAWGICYLLEQKPDASWMKQGMRLVVFALLALPVRYAIERLKPFSDIDRRPHSLYLPGSGGPDVVLFNSPHPVEEMFFGDGVAYEQRADSATRVRLTAAGYRVVILNK